MTRTMTPIGRAVLEAREGKRNTAYRDAKGVWTIGVGHTGAAGPPAPFAGLSLSDREVDAIFARDLQAYEVAVDRSLRVAVADHEFDALVSIAYNIGQAGESHATFLTRLNAGDHLGAASAISLWERDACLIPRREAERAQFLTPYDVRLPSRVAGEPPIRMPAALGTAPVRPARATAPQAAAAPRPSPTAQPPSPAKPTSAKPTSAKPTSAKPTSAKPTLPRPGWWARLIASAFGKAA